MAALEIAKHGASLGMQGRLLAVEAPGATRRTFALEDVDILILQVPAVSVSGAALNALASAGVPVMICSGQHTPSAWVQPLSTSGVFDPRRAERQARLPTRTRQRLWRSIVRAKIALQADVLRDAGKPDARLRRLIGAVAPGDPSNVEATAAQLYWPALFGPEFRRREDSPVTAALNWGYAVLRSMICRSLVAAGLHPGIGIHHRSPENGFNLADDLMEPYRPVVDRLVYDQWRTDPQLRPRAWKEKLAALGEHPVDIAGQATRCRAAVRQSVQSFVRAVDTGGGTLELPRRIERIQDAGRLAEDVAAGDV